MEIENFENELKLLLTLHNPENLISTLINIRSKLLNNEKLYIEKIYETENCLEYLIKILESSDTKVVTLSLSILESCCGDNITAQDVVKKYNALPHLSRLLKNSNDEILGSVCVLIGNFCQHELETLGNDIIVNEDRFEIVNGIMNILKMVTDADCSQRNVGMRPSKYTVLMAIRALEKLIYSYTIDALIEKYELAKVIGYLINKFTLLWIDTKQNEDVLKAILNLLLFCSKYKFNKIICDLKSIDTGDAMVYVSELVVIFPGLIHKIMEGLLKSCRRAADLPINATVDSLINKLKSTNGFECEIEDTTYSEYLQCLCFLVRFKSGPEALGVDLIAILLNALANYKNPTELAVQDCETIIRTLHIHSRDCSQFMLRCGILDLLSEKLNWVLESKDNVRINNSSPLPCKRTKYFAYNELSCEMEQMFDKQHRTNLHSFNNVTIRQKRSDKKLRSPSFDYNILPILNLNATPNSTSSDYEMEVINDESDSSNLSVCSDGDDELILREEDFLDVKKKTEGLVYMNRAVSSSFCLAILRLLKILVDFKPVEELSSSDVVFKLLLFFLPQNESVRPLHLLEFIMYIIQPPEYLIGFLKQTNLMYVIHKFSIPRHSIYCFRCVDLFLMSNMILSYFAKVVEKSSGKENIALELHRGSLLARQKLIVSVPFIVEETKTFSNLMLTYGGLNLLVDILKENLNLQRICLSSLTTMARKLQVQDPTENSNICDLSSKQPLDPEDYRYYQNYKNIVYFKLDDGSQIQSDREFLSSKSYFFDRLLFGQFKESQEEMIRLCNVASRPFKLMLLLLHNDVKTKSVTNLFIDLYTLLETIALSNRFLLEDLCSFLTKCVRYFKLSPKTAPTIYKWSVNSCTNILRLESVTYILIGCMSESQRYKVVAKLIQSGYVDYLINDIKELFGKCLGMSTAY